MSIAKHKDSALMNHLLAALPAEEFARLSPNLEPVTLSLGQVIYESGEQLEHVFFPHDCDHFLALYYGEWLNRRDWNGRK